MNPEQTTPNAGTSGIEIFLGRGGETFGPYTPEEFEALKAGPDFASYTYVWDGRDANPDWKPLAPPPAKPAPRKAGPGAPPPDARIEPAAKPEAARAPATGPARPVLKGYDVPSIEALCHDSRFAIAGKLFGVTDAGCELIASGARSEPAFGAKASVVLNLLDPGTGKCMNVPARLNGVRRKDGAWSYRVLWDGCPELVLQQLEKSA